MCVCVCVCVCMCEGLRVDWKEVQGLWIGSKAAWKGPGTVLGLQATLHSLRPFPVTPIPTVETAGHSRHPPSLSNPVLNPPGDWLTRPRAFFWKPFSTSSARGIQRLNLIELRPWCSGHARAGDVRVCEGVGGLSTCPDGCSASRTQSTTL